VSAAPHSARGALLHALNFQRSGDPLDTRPDTSGNVPRVHYNISPNSQLDYTGHLGLGAILNFLLHGGGQRQDNQVNNLTLGLRHAGLDPRTANFIAERHVFNPYNRPT
jgi:hypothetical protein